MFCSPQATVVQFIYDRHSNFSINQLKCDTPQFILAIRSAHTCPKKMSFNGLACECKTTLQKIFCSFFSLDVRTSDFQRQKFKNKTQHTEFTSTEPKNGPVKNVRKSIDRFCIAHVKMFSCERYEYQVNWCCFVERSRYTVPTKVLSRFDIGTHCEDSVLNSLAYWIGGFSGLSTIFLSLHFFVFSSVLARWARIGKAKRVRTTSFSSSVACTAKWNCILFSPPVLDHIRSHWLNQLKVFHSLRSLLNVFILTKMCNYGHEVQSTKWS